MLRTALVLVLAGGLAACGGREAGIGQTEEGSLVLGEAEQTAVVTRGVEPGGRRLVLDGFSGSITLRGVEAPNAELTFTKHARGRDAADARKVLDRITLEETGDAEMFRYVLRAGDASLSRVDVEGTVPRGTPITIELQSGVVQLSALEGPLSVTVESGRIALAGAGRSVEATLRNGPIEAGFFRLATDATVALRTTNGDVALTLPASASARLEARTDAGDVRVEGLAVAERRLAPEGAGARFQGRLGDGAATVTLRTENGTIALREGTVLHLPGLDDAPAEEAPADDVPADDVPAEEAPSMDEIPPAPLDSTRRSPAI